MNAQQFSFLDDAPRPLPPWDELHLVAGQLGVKVPRREPKRKTQERIMHEVRERAKTLMREYAAHCAGVVRGTVVEPSAEVFALWTEYLDDGTIPARG